VPFSLFTEYDIHLFRNGLHYKLYNLLGSHLVVVNGVKGVYFAVWAPSASNVTVMGDFNYWRTSQYRFNPRWDNSGIWEGFVPGVKQGAIYKYNITGPDGKVYEKGDPYAFRWEVPPGTGSIVWDIKDYSWRDKSWLEGRKKFNKLQSPISAYEVHLGSWKKPERKETSFLTYKQLKDELVPYVKEMGFTHVELMPVMEHPYYPSWGYQIIGYYATTSRFGSPQEFMELVDAFHQEGIGVILDWVPSHFPSDGHSLSYFDGTHLYEHGNPQLGYHPDWKSLIFDYGKKEVKSFLISNAVFWCEMYHADGLRVDAVASMIHLDYSRKDGEWTPNKHGGRENLEAIDFIKEMNQAVHAYHPDVITIAEESTSFPFVTAPVNDGGLGFDEKWMMGWMHDTLKYFALDPIHRQFHHDQITFSMVYAYSEKFVLPFSHDEVVHGKGSLLTRMPGDEWQKFANLRAMLGYMFTHPGAKLLFMGGEFGQSWEWSHINGLEWHLLRFAYHSGIQGFVKELNRLYTTYNALYYHNFHPAGFEWLSVNDRENSVLIFLRKGKTEVDKLIIVLNLTPVIREHYRFGVPDKGSWRELLNSDDKKWGGSGVHNKSAIRATKKAEHNRDYSISITCPPLSIVVFEPVRVVKKTVKKGKP
ncbi:MAG TPA: 1,4-alpha-glucan branching protein GlgB, partial [Saprospiraceae bacterium]|nr:1,4-alpha-glucan branching protein GlgB [Saprospiraceae bacterium]